MEQYDPALAQRVWQRVQGETEPKAQSLRALVHASREREECYRRLSQRFGGRDGELLARMYRQEQDTGACLRGMERLRGQPGKASTAVAEKAEPRRMLERCYHQSQRAMAEYRARTAEAEFGAVFELLAQREMAHCAGILEVLGRQKG